MSGQSSGPRSRPRFDDFDRRMMLRAVSLARRGQGRVEPNPMVGCVITRGTKIIGEGFHRRFGGPHAEKMALDDCASDPRAAAVFVSLEPCSHHGKTPPCGDALIAARVGRVVVAMRDPHPLVAGDGIRRLRKAGIGVDVGPCEKEVAELLAPYLTHVHLGRPYVIAKWAQSLDGKLATRRGESKWISSDESRRRVHRLRARVDAVLVGSGTARLDDPMLTARHVPLRRRAARVVLDGRLRILETCQLVGTAKSVPTLVLTRPDKAATPKARRLAGWGVDVVACRTRRDGLSLAHALRLLARRGVTNLLVEGGPTVLTSFLDARLVDEAWIFVAPTLIGGRGAPSAWGGRGVSRIAERLTPHEAAVRKSGADSLFVLRLTNPPTHARIR